MTEQDTEELIFIIFIFVMVSIIIYLGIQGDIEDKKQYLSNPKKYCIDNYSDSDTKNVPVKCLKHFN